jgi:hypothetical protein
MNARRNALSLAAVLAATVLTGGAAVLGITHPAQSPQASSAPIAQAVQPASPQEEGD